MSKVFKGAFALDGKIFDRWADEKLFAEDFEHIAAIMGARSGLSVTVDFDHLKITHERWTSVADAWLELLLPAETKRLSHLKMCAILLQELCDLTPLKAVLSDSNPTGPSYQDAGHSPEDLPNRLDEEDRQKILDGGSHYVGWQIVYQICRHFEANRTDRVDPFVERITEEFELDIVSALLSGRVTAQSIHLILKALFLRD